MKILKLTKYFVFFLSLSFLLQGCSEEDPSATSLKFVTFETKVKDIAVNPSETLVSDIKVFTTNVSGSAMTYAVEIDPASTVDPLNMNVPATVTIPANSNEGILSVSVEGVDLDLSVAKTIILKLIPEGDTYVGGSIRINVRENCPLNTVNLALILDRWGSETTWEITDSMSNVVASGGPYTDGSSNVLQPVKNFIFCLADGDYTFTIYDAYGDGMYTSATAIGSYIISANGSTLVSTQFASGSSQSHNFTL